MAVEWDRTMNARRLHHKVTDSHLHANLAEKMRNELAETMLNSEMLNLVKSYQNSLSNGSVLDEAIELLENTISLITIFRDKELVTSISDQRLSRLKEFFSGGMVGRMKSWNCKMNLSIKCFHQNSV